MAFHGQARYPPQMAPYGAGHPHPYVVGHPPTHGAGFPPPYGQPPPHVADYPLPYGEHHPYNQGPQFNHNQPHPVNMYSADAYGYGVHTDMYNNNNNNQEYAPPGYPIQAGENVDAAYSQQEPRRNYDDMYDHSHNLAPPPRPHVNPRFIPPEKETPTPPQFEETRIPRNPYPGFLKDDNRGTLNEEIYDPSFPTLSNNLKDKQPSNCEANSPGMGSKRFHHVTSTFVSNSGSLNRTPEIIPRTPILEHFISPQVNLVGKGVTSTSNSNTEVNKSKIQIMTGVVTQLQRGAFGMISDEIFFQDSCVSGPLPNVGDKVVVEAEPVHGMPFKFNAKKVTKLDLDLVRDETHEANHNFDNTDKNLDHPQLEPLPKMPESLNLPRHSPGNLSELIPSSTPLKSILKRNPPPPPVISSTQAQPSKPFKPTVFTVNLNKERPQLLPVAPESRQEFVEYTYVKNKLPTYAVGSPQITRLLPSSPPRQTDDVTWKTRNSVKRSPSPLRKIENFDRRHRENSPIGNQCVGISTRSISPRHKRSPRTLRGRPSSRSPMSCNRRRLNDRSRSRTQSPHRNRSKSPCRSRSKSPRRSRSNSPRQRKRSISRTRDRRNSRSYSRDRVRRKSRSRSRSKDRNYNRSPDRVYKSRASNVTSRKKYRRSRSSNSDSLSDSRNQGRYKSAERDRTTSKRLRPNRRNRSSSSGRSISPVYINEVYDRNKSHGIVLEKVTSSLFPKVHQEPKDDSITVSNVKPSNSKPTPIKFQINNFSKTVSSTSLVPNPTFKSGLQTQLMSSNVGFDNRKTVTQGKPKKPKEQEPAFRIVNKKSPSKASTVTPVSRQTTIEIAADKLLKNIENITQLKRTIQKDLHELRVVQNTACNKEAAAPTPTLNLKIVQELQETVTRDLHELKTSSLAKPTIVAPVPNIEKLKESVQQGLKDLRSKFDSHKQKPVKEPSQAHVSGLKPDDANQIVKTQIVTRILPEASPTHAEILHKNTNIQIVKRIINNPPAPAVGSDFSKSHINLDKERISKIPAVLTTHTAKVVDPKTVCKIPTKPSTAFRGPDIKQKKFPEPFVNREPVNENIERLKDEIHQQRLADEEHRLRSIGDMAGLQQMYYLEDRRRRRQEERKLSQIRLLETKLKREKNFGELARLRNEYGPSAERFQNEQELRRIRLEEQQQESQQKGQADAIKRQELDYQEWLESEAVSRNREIERANRGFEGRVKRRRTPSPRNDDMNQRSYGFERNRDHHGRRESNIMVNREASYSIEGPPAEHFSHHPDFEYHQGGEQDESFLSRAIDDVGRRHDELVQREMENQHRLIEMAERRHGGDNFHHENDHRREEYGRFSVRRR